MLVLIVLALLALGAVLGAAGMRRLGRWTAQASDRWRPGVGVAALITAFAGLALTVRGAWLFGLPALAAAGAMALGARRRAAGHRPPAGMGEAEARSILGIGPGASPEDIQAAYVRLMQRVHPDRGGAAGLASQLNAARERLLG